MLSICITFYNDKCNIFLKQLLIFAKTVNETSLHLQIKHIWLILVTFQQKTARKKLRLTGSTMSATSAVH